MATGAVHPTAPTGPAPSNPQSAPNLVHFDPKAVVPSQPIYLQRNDYIGFYLLTNLAAATVRIRYRWLTPDGEIKEGEFVTPPFTGSFVGTVPLYEGWLLSFVGSITSGSLGGSFCFLQAILFRNPLAGVVGNAASAMIWQGYIGGNAGNGYPGTPSKEITDGAGFLRPVTGATPAAGADISEIVPTQRRSNLVAIFAVLVTSATVANRNATFVIDDGSNVLYQSPAVLNQPASTSLQYTAATQPSNALPIAGPAALELSLPFPTRTGFHIKTATLNLQAGDQWAAPHYLIQEWGAWDS